MKTIKFVSTLGSFPGCKLRNGDLQKIKKVVAKEWQCSAKKVMEKRGFYVSSNVISTKITSNLEWGFSVGGDDGLIITGFCNPDYIDISDYKKAVKDILEKVIVSLGIAKASFYFTEIEIETIENPLKK